MGWSYNHLTIKLREDYRSKRYIEIENGTNISLLVEISGYGIFSRVEGLDENSSELQHIKIYAKDEFNQEKFIEAVVKITNTTVKQLEKKLETVHS